jgi:DNA-binding cell septation regulator SpoVG
MTSKSSKVQWDFSSHFPNRKLNDGTRWDIAFPANAETRNMIQQAILAEYEKVTPESDPARQARTRKLTPTSKQ